MVINGEVTKGSGDGTKLGFPTANLKLDIELELDFGVYACKVEVLGSELQGIFHYGPRYIFDETTPKFEVHIFDFSQTIYGETISVKVVEFIRGSKNFESVDDLIAQMRIDVSEAKEILRSD